MVSLPAAANASHKNLVKLIEIINFFHRIFPLSFDTCELKFNFQNAV